LRYRLNADFGEFNYPYCFRVDAEAHDMQLLGERVIGARLRGAVYLLKHRLVLPTVLTFRRASHQTSTLAYVEATHASETEIIKAGARACVQIDMSTAPKPPSNAILAGVIQLDLNQPTRVPDFKVIGSPEHRIDIWNAEFSVAEGW
jgi:hypothetical protein